VFNNQGIWFDSQKGKRFVSCPLQQKAQGAPPSPNQGTKEDANSSCPMTLVPTLSKILGQGIAI
jgi:hypothetical protein